MKIEMKKRLIKTSLILFAVFLFLVLLLVSIISVNATEVMSKEAVLNYKGHKITMLDVSEDYSCIFKIDDKTVVAGEHEEAKYNGVIVWVKDAVKMHSQGDNYCEFIITLEEPKVTETKATNKTSKYEDEVKAILEKAKDAAEAVDDKVNLSINMSGIINKTNETSDLVTGIENAPITKTEKSIIARFIEWIKGLFD